MENTKVVNILWSVDPEGLAEAEAVGMRDKPTSETTAPEFSDETPVLVLVRDSGLVAEVRRIAAAAGRQLDERQTPIGRHPWATAPVIVLDTPAAQDCLAYGLPRRGQVVTVTDGPPVTADWQVAMAIGSEAVVGLPDSAGELIEKFADCARRGRGGGVVVAVVGVGGGAGASTLAAALALRASEIRYRAHTVLVDGAPQGGGLDVLLGMEKVAGLRWPDLVIRSGRIAAAALHHGLPTVGGLSVLSCGRWVPGPGDQQADLERYALGAAAVQAVVEASRGAGDAVVCDVSSERGEHAQQMIEAADLVLVVVPARLRAVLAAEMVVAWVGQYNPNQMVVARGPAPGNLATGEIAEALGVPLLTGLRWQAGLSARVERGGLRIGRGPLRDCCDAALAALGEPARAWSR